MTASRLCLPEELPETDHRATGSTRLNTGFVRLSELVTPVLSPGETSLVCAYEVTRSWLRLTSTKTASQARQFRSAALFQFSRNGEPKFSTVQRMRQNPSQRPIGATRFHRRTSVRTVPYRRLGETLRQLWDLRISTHRRLHHQRML